MKPAGTQTDRNMDFDGMQSMGVKRSSKFQGNQYTGVCNEGALINKGVGPRKGNQDYRGAGGPSVTKDKFRETPNTKSVPSTAINADRINLGRQERNPGGTRSWEPKLGQNYAGNPDRIRIGQTGDGTYNREQASKRPATAGGETDFNYGPKSQY